MSGTSDSGCGQARHTPSLRGDVCGHRPQGCVFASLLFALLPVLTSSLDKLAETSWGSEQPLSPELIEEGLFGGVDQMYCPLTPLLKGL